MHDNNNKKPNKWDLITACLTLYICFFFDSEINCIPGYQVRNQEGIVIHACHLLCGVLTYKSP